MFPLTLQRRQRLRRPAKALDRGADLWLVLRFYKYRHLSKDYEYLTDTSEAMIYVAMIYVVMVRRIAAKIP